MSREIKILLHQGHGLIGTLIKWQTRSKYSHCALLFIDGSSRMVVESEYPAGVTLDADWKPENDRRVIDQFGLPEGTYDYDRCLMFAMAQLGKRYDFGSVLRFISRRQANRRSAGVWFCSELVFAAIQVGGLNLLFRVEPWAVSPGTIVITPLLNYEKTHNAIADVCLPAGGVHDHDNDPGRLQL